MSFFSKFFNRSAQVHPGIDQKQASTATVYTYPDISGNKRPIDSQVSCSTQSTNTVFNFDNNQDKIQQFTEFVIGDDTNVVGTTSLSEYIKNSSTDLEKVSKVYLYKLKLAIYDNAHDVEQTEDENNYLLQFYNTNLGIQIQIFDANSMRFCNFHLPM